MSLATDLTSFRANALCANLSEADAASLHALALPVSFIAGARIVRQGEPSRGAWVLRTGAVEARVALSAGGDQVVARIEAGQYFGETALLDQGQCNASVVAVQNVDGWFLERESFRALAVSRHPGALSLQRTLTRTLADRLSRLNSALLSQPAPEDRPQRARPAQGLQRIDSPGFHVAAFLSLLPFFQGFQPDEMDAVVAGLAVMTCPRGQALFVPGDSSDACYLLVRGAVEVLAARSGQERRMALLGPGALAGYLSVLSGSPHGATAVARENSLLIELPAVRFHALFNGDSGPAVKVQHAIQRNLLQSLGRSNSQMSRLVTQARLDDALRARAGGIAV